METNLEEGEEAAKTTTLRQRLERHRASPTCASCHNIMDPLGFALENYDLIGAWRQASLEAEVLRRLELPVEEWIETSSVEEFMRDADEYLEELRRATEPD